MGLLDQLKEQARSVQSESARPDTEALERNRLLVNGACRRAHDYWKELAEQLNALRPPCRARYLIDARAPLDGLTCGDYRTVPQMQVGHGGEARYQSIVLAWQASNGKQYRITKELPRDIERMRACLVQAGTPCHETAVRNTSTGRVQATSFEFRGAVTASVRLTPLPDVGKVRLSFVNLDQLERVDAEYPAAVLRERLLDEIGRWIIGEPHTVLEYAAEVKRYAH